MMMIITGGSGGNGGGGNGDGRCGMFWLAESDMSIVIGIIMPIIDLHQHGDDGDRDPSNLLASECDQVFEYALVS